MGFKQNSKGKMKLTIILALFISGLAKADIQCYQCGFASKDGGPQRAMGDIPLCPERADPETSNVMKCKKSSCCLSSRSVLTKKDGKGNIVSTDIEVMHDCHESSPFEIDFPCDPKAKLNSLDCQKLEMDPA